MKAAFWLCVSAANVVFYVATDSPPLAALYMLAAAGSALLGLIEVTS